MYFQKLYEIQICKLIFGENFIKNTILQNKIQKTYILRTNKFGEENGKYCSQKTKLKKIFFLAKGIHFTDNLAKKLLQHKFTK